MSRAQAEKRLAALGFVIDWAVTGPADGYWSGTIDAIGRGQIGGDCRGEVVYGANAADWYAKAIVAAEGYRGCASVCEDPDCEFHEDQPLT